MPMRNKFRIPGNFSIPLIEKLELDACLENDELSVNPLKEHLLTI